MSSAAAAESRPLRVWIDATDPRSGRRLFGMPLLERLLRGLGEAGLAPEAVRIEHAAGARLPELPADLARRLRVRAVEAEGPAGERLARAAREAPGCALLALEGGAVVDPRLLGHVSHCHGSVAACAGSGEERTAVLRLEAEPPPVQARGLAEAAGRWTAGGVLRELRLEDVPDYLPKLRRRLTAYAFRVPDAAARGRAERFLFESNYKGSTDFFTKHVYPPLVWALVRPLARLRVHPNWVSLMNVMLAAAAVPLFASAQWAAGLSAAYAMSVLDSVDGKLARLTFRASKLGHVLDHGLDVVHPPFWYSAWAFALAGGDVASGVFLASLWLAGFYFLDRIVTELFTRRTRGRSIHAYAPIDVRMRTWISRRNINVPIFTVGLIAGVPVWAFGGIVAWQVATLGFHALRLAQVWPEGAGAGGRRPARGVS